MVAESEIISRYVFQEICLSNRIPDQNQKAKKNPPYFNVVQKPRAIFTLFVFLDFFQAIIYFLLSNHSKIESQLLRL